MPKITKYPRLHTRVRRGKSGQVWTYYYWDGRPDGVPDTPLGSDRLEAIAGWERLKNKQTATGRIQEGIDSFRIKVLVGTPENPSPYTNEETVRGYTKNLKMVEKWCGRMLWKDMTLPLMREYLRKRTGKTQANRELSALSLVWSHARMEGFTALPWPAADMKRRKWKNKEQARKFRVTDELFDAVYEMGNATLKSVMDVATATGMRLTDARTVELPEDDILRLEASKTGKEADFDIALSSVLPDLVARRRAMTRPTHNFLVTTERGNAVSEKNLRAMYNEAREAAAYRAEHRGKPELAQAIRKMLLRDMRKRASDLAPSLEAAAQLLQHSSKETTRAHYRTEAERLPTVR